MNKLFPFQESGVEFLVERSRALLASDAGVGKSVMAITAVNAVCGREYWGTSKKLHILVLCPKSVRLSWEREIEKWCCFGGAIYWTVTNWDSLLTKRSKDLIKPWDIIIADESHMCIKNPDCKRAKVFIDQLVPSAKRVWLLTATPASKSGYDYYGTLQVLLPSLMKDFSRTAFKRQYCEEVYCPFSPTRRKYVGFKNTDVLREVFSKVAIRHKKEEVLKDLPPKLYTNLMVEVDPSIVAMNLEIDEEYVSDLIKEGRALPGHIAHVMQANAMAKVNSIVEWIENFPSTESLVVFAWHRSVVQALADRIPGSEIITGQTGDEERQETVDNFQKGSITKLICNMVAGGVGITLTKARTAMFVELPFSPAHLIQAENRVHRIGSIGEHIHIVRVIGSRTIDEKIWSVLTERVEAIRQVGV